MTHATRDRSPRHTWSRSGLGGTIPRDPPEGGGVGESRPVKEGSRGRPGRHRHKTMTGPRKESQNGERETSKDPTAQSAATAGSVPKWGSLTSEGYG